MHSPLAITLLRKRWVSIICTFHHNYIAAISLYTRFAVSRVGSLLLRPYYLAVTIVLLTMTFFQEVVSLGDETQCPPEELPQKTGTHLKPEEWHDQIKSASSNEPPILLDTRNIYETSIGHFEAVSLSQISSSMIRSRDQGPAYCEGTQSNPPTIAWSFFEALASIITCVGPGKLSYAPASIWQHAGLLLSAP